MHERYPGVAVRHRKPAGMRNFFIGAAGAFNLAYAAQRAVTALRTPAQPQDGTQDAHAYGRLRRRLMLAGIARSLAQLGVIAYGVAPAAEDRFGPVTAPLRRAGTVALASLATAVLELPVDYVEDYVLERRYALSDQPAAGWLADRAKSLVLSTGVSTVLLELLSAAIARAPARWPLVATAGTVPLLILANLVVPIYVLPLFNRFEAYNGPLAGRIRDLSAQFGAADPTILRVDMSRQTRKANAYVTGLFGSHRIVLGDTLLDHFADDEVLFVVAHELGHYVSRDVWRSVALGTAASAAIFFGGARLGTADGLPYSLTGLARFFFVASLLSIAAGPMLAAASRRRERAADQFALRATHDPASGARAFERLRERNLAEDEQPRWMELLFSSHPSLKSRITTLQAAAAASAVPA